jgi:hypothetical protein
MVQEERVQELDFGVLQSAILVCFRADQNLINLSNGATGIEESISSLKTKTTAEHEDISYYIIILSMYSASSFRGGQRQCAIDRLFGAKIINFLQEWTHANFRLFSAISIPECDIGAILSGQTSRNSPGYGSQDPQERERESATKEIK